MLRLMQKKALLLLSEGESEGTESSSDTGADGSPVSEPKFDVGTDGFNKSSVLEAENDEIQVNSDVGTNSLAVSESKASTSGPETEATSGLGSRGQRIKGILERELSPVVLELEDISDQRAGHAVA
ncbi:sufE-like protein 1, chloroplastic/mitochondrial [Punica granatum]|nr:sufE-like protein 1, chloroplastic/mitochondrial [Punica granatum]